MRPLPDRLMAYLESWDGTVAAPRDAATLMVLREGDTGFEALLMRRQRSMAFASGMHVFPGGSVQPTDGEPVPWVGPAPAEWAHRWDCDPDQARALVVAAVRETFEETGILFAGPGPDSVLGVCAGAEWTEARRALETGEITMAAFLAARGLVLRADLLGAWAHWITPEFEPRRFDTRFFIAVLPEQELAHTHSTEADVSFWIDLADAVTGADQGVIAMMTPTRHNLELIAAAGPEGVARAVAGAGRRIPTIQPRLVEINGRHWLTTVEDADMATAKTVEKET
ncbi:NUDIX hydrolase [Gordonia polyisoprenivorans]|uniref:NUDIX hydrolase n=1 Tax=Gordonia polyisoprenivorans TaxID=84595 RepID=UPI001AD7D166|nr:NUDIX domain-containing protein [Gordonia polyisoprenivorans]QTI70965.1 NUDIX domain-containing protein [Gordonia polyisoprenivorans]